MNHRKIKILIPLLTILVLSCGTVKKDSYVTLTGIAKNLKPGAAVVVNNKYVYYLHDMFYWDEGIV